MKHILLTFLLWLAALTVGTMPAYALDVPKQSGYVTDISGVLSQREKNDLELRLGRNERQSHRTMVALIVPTLQGLTPEEFVLKVGQAWGIVNNEAQNGVLLLISTGDVSVGIAIGDALGDILPDKVRLSILNRRMLPGTENQDYWLALLRGISAVQAKLRGMDR